MSEDALEPSKRRITGGSLSLILFVLCVIIQIVIMMAVQANTCLPACEATNKMGDGATWVGVYCSIGNLLLLILAIVTSVGAVLVNSGRKQGLITIACFFALILSLFFL